MIKIYSRKNLSHRSWASFILTLCHRIISFKFWESFHPHWYPRRVYLIVSWFTLSIRRIAYDIMVEKIMKSSSMIWAFIWEFEKPVIQVSHYIVFPDNTIVSDFYSDRVIVSDKKYKYILIMWSSTLQLIIHF